MPWNPGLTKLRDLLAELYPTEQLSRQVLAQAGLPTGRIHFTSAATSNWQNILAEADRHRKVRAVIAVASQEYPNQSGRLAQLTEDYEVVEAERLARAVQAGADTSAIVVQQASPPIHGTLVFQDAMDPFSGWENFGHGTVSQSSEVSRVGSHSLKKQGAGDPSGGSKIVSMFGHGHAFSGWLYRPDEVTRANGDRLAIENQLFSGYGFTVAHFTDFVWIERRDNAVWQILGEPLRFRPPRGAWYEFRFYIEVEGKFQLFLYSSSGEELCHTDQVSDIRYSAFDRVSVRGGHPYYVDHLRIEKLGG